MYRDKPNLVRVGSLIQCDYDSDIGVVIKVVSPIPARGYDQQIFVWWRDENVRDPCTGVTDYNFEPWYNRETVLRY